MSDPCFYREYESNLSAPYVRGTKALKAPTVQATTVNATSLNANSLTLADSGIEFYSGSFPNSATHTFTSTQIPSLASDSCNGELSLYLNNDAYVGVAMAVVVRAKNVTLQNLLYQKVGNFTSIEASISGNDLVFTVSPAATCSWFFRGK
jgi:hypothetical protein